MDGENPYAPPLTGEIEAPASRSWQVDGIGVLVKNLAALPMVDLNTGEQGGDLKCVRRSLVKGSPLTMITTGVITSGYFFLNKRFDISLPVLVIVLFLVNMLAQRITAVRGAASRKLDVMEYLGKKSSNRLLRGRIRLWVYLVLVLFFVSGALRLVPYFPAAFLVFVLLGLAVWTFLDRAPAKSHSGPPGWMKISPVHQDTLRFLTALQQKEEEEAAERSLGSATGEPSLHRKRRSIWFHKHPLAMLIGNRRNPLAILDTVLAKLLRSPLLTREAWHFSDAVPTPAGDLCMEMREEIGAWTTAHPDWVLRTSDRIIFPDGTIIVETVHLAPPTFDCDLSFTCSWNVVNPALRSLHRTFVSWAAGGTRIITADHRRVALEDPSLEVHQVNGSLAELHQAHLRNCTGKPLDPPRDEADRAARMSSLLEEIDLRLTELGYQSELR
ncbi:MAG: hypothetical protein EOP85_04880 [Verrucomicrobiaceae bacterium]|nr:MAG: hypothetical protein EOP85_04880 [Verrucomicrobiaceae bacterium]